MECHTIQAEENGEFGWQDMGPDRGTRRVPTRSSFWHGGYRSTSQGGYVLCIWEIHSTFIYVTTVIL